MDASAPQWLVALETSGLGAAIRQSVWIYPSANVAHVAAMAAFAGSVVLIDLILLGIVRPIGRAAILLRARRWSMGLFAMVVLSGLVLFIAEASHVALNRVFQLKLGLIALAVLNALVLGSRAEAAVAKLTDTEPLPAHARRAAAASLCLWLCVVALGRFIAYV
jgi:hypothetical protein